MMLPLVSSGKGFRIAVTTGAALISNEAIFCTGRILGGYHRILMAGSRIIGVFLFGSRTGLAIADIIAVLSASVRYSFPKCPIVDMFRGLGAILFGQLFCLGVIAAGAEADSQSGAGGRWLLCRSPITKSVTQRSNLGILIAAAAALTGMGRVSGSRTGWLHNLRSVIMG